MRFSTDVDFRPLAARQLAVANTLGIGSIVLISATRAMANTAGHDVRSKGAVSTSNLQVLIMRATRLHKTVAAALLLVFAVQLAAAAASHRAFLMNCAK